MCTTYDHTLHLFLVYAMASATDVMHQNSALHARLHPFQHAFHASEAAYSCQNVHVASSSACTTQLILYPLIANMWLSWQCPGHGFYLCLTLNVKFEYVSMYLNMFYTFPPACAELYVHLDHGSVHPALNALILHINIRLLVCFFATCCAKSPCR